MNEIPAELYGLPAGAVIVLAVEGLKQIGLPGQYAGVAAIVIATIIGTLFLMGNGQIWEVALGKGVTFGLAIVAAHYSAIRPLTPASAPPAGPPPAQASSPAVGTAPAKDVKW